MAQPSDLPSRVAVLESHVAMISEAHGDHHERLRSQGETFVAINGKLDSIAEKLDSLAGNEARIRSLEDWRTGLVAKMAVIAVIASFAAAILTALAIKIVDKAVIPQSAGSVGGGALSPVTPADMPVDSRGWPRYRGQ